MKKFVLNLFVALIGLSAAQAQINVTFRVDMTGQTVNPGGVFVAGNFQSLIGAGGDFVAGVNQMTNTSGNIYEFVATGLPESIYQYKFYNGPLDSNAETVPAPNAYPSTTNRYAATFTDTLLPAIRFGGTAPAGLELMELGVDLYFYSPDLDNGVHVMGSFQSALGGSNWNPASTRVFDYVGDDPDQIYHQQFFVPAGSYDFKFINGITLAQAEVLPAECAPGANTSRTVTVALGNPVEDYHCFASCNLTCLSVGEQKVSPSSIQSYPNPCDGRFMIKGLRSDDQIRLCDLSGRSLQTWNGATAQSTLVAEVSAGIYLVQVIRADGTVSVQRLSVQH